MKWMFVKLWSLRCWKPWIIPKAIIEEFHYSISQHHTIVDHFPIISKVFKTILFFWSKWNVCLVNVEANRGLGYNIHPNFRSWNCRCPFINFDCQKRYVGCNLTESSEFDSSSFIMMILYPYHRVMTLFLRYTNWCIWVHTYAPSKSNLGPLYNRPTTVETRNGAFLLTKCSKFGPLAFTLGPKLRNPRMIWSFAWHHLGKRAEKWRPKLLEPLYHIIYSLKQIFAIVCKPVGGGEGYTLLGSIGFTLLGFGPTKYI